MSSGRVSGAKIIGSILEGKFSDDEVGWRRFSGIGSRETPEGVGVLMVRISRAMGLRGLRLRSGAAAGADSYFEAGAHGAEIFVAWESMIWKRGIAGARNKWFDWSKMDAKLRMESLEEAGVVHPNWAVCRAPVRSLLARNVMILRGEKLSDNSLVTVCWTKGGKDVGGTGSALRLCDRYGIPVVNLAIPEDHKMMSDFCDEILG